MKFVPSEATRKEYIRKIKGFWEDYRRNKIGLMGIAILIMFISVSLLAPWLTPYHPTQSKYLAESLAMPKWVTILPQFSDLPPTMEILACWNVQNGSDLVNVELGEKTTIRYNGIGIEKTDVYLHSAFSYPYVPSRTFKYKFEWESLFCSQAGYSLELILVTPEGYSYSFCDSYYGLKVKKSQEIPLLKEETGSTHRLKADSWDFRVWDRLGWHRSVEYLTLTSQVFRSKGEYYVLLHVVFEPSASNATCEIIVKETQIIIPGLIHGLLGTDQYGGDLFCQLVYSTRTSLMIGMFTALSITAIGVIVGVVAGYVGGAIDELFMRTADVVLCIPMLPILITLAVLFGANMYFIVLLLSMLWWPGIARVIRSRVLSLREKTFVVSARAVGASKPHIMLKHIIPNVLPLAFAALILNVPSAIITEAVISFIGITPLTAPTWGKMLHYAFHAGAFQRLAWWWIVPPGLALMILALAFVFIGHAVDEIVNPRLRRRR
jgi:peptide/nickel transport system permease protein